MGLSNHERIWSPILRQAQDEVLQLRGCVVNSLSLRERVRVRASPPLSQEILMPAWPAFHGHGTTATHPLRMNAPTRDEALRFSKNLSGRTVLHRGRPPSLPDLGGDGNGVESCRVARVSSRLDQDLCHFLFGEAHVEARLQEVAELVVGSQGSECGRGADYP